MTYCVGLRLNRGLVFMSDTRTNASIDNIAKFKKMYTWEVPGDRVITLMSAGNLATTQAVIGLLDERIKTQKERAPSIYDAPSMFQVARLIGQTVKEVIRGATEGGQESEGTFGASFILGGQIKGSGTCLFQVYPEGNFIEATDDTPFFQIGEHKYGRPIIVRAYDPDMTFEEATKLLLVSFDSTLKSNLSVGMPIDLQFYETDSFKRGYEERIEQTDPYFTSISDGWSDALKIAFTSLPDFKTK